MTLATLIFIIIGIILFLWANIYSIKEIIAYPETDNAMVAITVFIDVILFVIGGVWFFDWAITIKLW